MRRRHLIFCTSSEGSEPVYFEDFEVGQRYTTDSRTMTEAEIIDFAGQWDKQFFHLDKEKAEQSMYGGLIASGFHTLLVSFDLVVGRDIWRESSRGSPGIENLRWIRPVRPGDTLTVDFEVVAVKPSTTRGDRGYVTWDHFTRNQHGEVVMSYRSVGISLRRDPLPDPAGA